MDRITKYNVIDMAMPKSFKILLPTIPASIENVKMQAP